MRKLKAGKWTGRVVRIGTSGDLSRVRMRGSMRGFTLIEILAALAISALMVTGVVAMINSSLEDMRGQQTAMYQQQIGVAAKQLIQTNAATLSQQASPTVPVVVPFNSGGAYQLSKFLPAAMRTTNPYGQTPCLLVYTDSNGALVGLLVTEGGTTIADSELGYIAANSGQGGGSIPATNNAAGSAIGAFGAWTLTSPNPAGASCTTTKTGTGHLASEVYYNGNQVQNSDYLYRVSVPNDLAANTMQVPIILSVQTDYAACANTGAVAADSAGNVVTCLSGTGKWMPQASFHWRGTVAKEADLANVDPKSLYADDIVIATDTNRAYRYDGANWQALAVDQNGNLQLGNSGTLGAPCPQPSTSTTEVTTDATGRVLTCTSTLSGGGPTWQTQSEINPTSVPMDSACAIAVGQPGTSDFPCTVAPSGAPVFNNAMGYWQSVVTRNVPQMPRNGNIVVYSWAHMTDSFVTNCPGAPQDLSAGGGAYVTLYAELVDVDTGATIASAVNQSSAIRGDLTNINITLAHELAKNNKGYQVRFTTFWIIFNSSVNSAAFQTSFCNGNTRTPTTGVVTSWTITPFY
ncbi:shufflon system plasmid conjugative transfer pilus tip adhesin PilV [Paraburkholderia flava]|uniref:shufflon system plasmid conjugative transfer pilus tip adhesin PilV n=1 Tax=Paraburkholderia flava TaxID=2547393 RepID=UPI0014152B93|nr:shufflon system plasmid conjugative transfer pilus tip adhesin PilV [Paraburkholderia flava]